MGDSDCRPRRRRYRNEGNGHGARSRTRSASRRIVPVLHPSTGGGGRLASRDIRWPFAKSAQCRSSFHRGRAKSVLPPLYRGCITRVGCCPEEKFSTCRAAGRHIGRRRVCSKSCPCYPTPRQRPLIKASSTPGHLTHEIVLLLNTTFVPDRPRVHLAMASRLAMCSTSSTRWLIGSSLQDHSPTAGHREARSSEAAEDTDRAVRCLRSGRPLHKHAAR